MSARSFFPGEDSMPPAVSTANGRVDRIACRTFFGVSPPARRIFFSRLFFAKSETHDQFANLPVPPYSPGSAMASKRR